MRVAVVLLLYQSRSWMDGCLATLIPALRAAGGGGVVLVDQGSDDGARECSEALLSAAGVPFVVETPGRNLGVAGGRNAGARAAGRLPGGAPAWLLFLDTDTELRNPAVLAELLAFADAHPAAAILGPRLCGPGGELQRSARRFPRPFDLAANRLAKFGVPGFAARAARYHLEGFAFESARPVAWIAGAAQLMRTDLFAALGGFEPGYFYGLEETDHCLRAWKAGHEVWFVPAGPVTHHVQRLSSRSWRFLALHLRSAFRYFAAHLRDTAAAESRLSAAEKAAGLE